MKKVKQLLKRLAARLPSGIRHRLINFYHLLEAIWANLRYGFPSRDMQVVMITGTNGKTTTASYLGSILQQAGFKTGVCTTAYFDINGERQVNDQNATVVHPKVLQRMLKEMKKAGVTHLVLEVTSHALEQHRVWGVSCDTAVMTNLTQDHLDYHGTMEAYAAAKAKIFACKPRFVVLNRDDEWFDYFDKFEAGSQKITYGTHEESECRIKQAKLHRKGSDVKLLIDHQTAIDFSTQLPGKFNVYNATAAISAAYLMNIDLGKIKDGVAALESVPGRLQYIESKKPFDIIVDYAHTPDAMENLLSTLRELTKERLILVFGATGDRDKGKRPVMGEIAARLADRIILTDDETYSEDPSTIRKMVMEGIKQAKGAGKTDEVGDRRDAIAKAIKIARKGDTIVVTGMGHEQFRVENGKKIPWNEVEIVSELANS